MINIIMCVKPLLNFEITSLKRGQKQSSLDTNWVSTKRHLTCQTLLTKFIKQTTSKQLLNLTKLTLHSKVGVRGAKNHKTISFQFQKKSRGIRSRRRGGLSWRRRSETLLPCQLKRIIRSLLASATNMGLNLINCWQIPNLNLQGLSKLSHQLSM